MGYSLHCAVCTRQLINWSPKPSFRPMWSALLPGSNFIPLLLAVARVSCSCLPSPLLPCSSALFSCAPGAFEAICRGVFADASDLASVALREGGDGEEEAGACSTHMHTPHDINTNSSARTAALDNEETFCPFMNITTFSGKEPLKSSKRTN